MSNDKAIAACRDLYLVQQEIKNVTDKIGDSLNLCEMRKASGNNTHLGICYETWVSDEDSYFPEKRMQTDGEIADLLSEGGDLECQNCLKAHKLVLHRKELKKQRGKIRRAITLIGKEAAK